MPYSHLRITAKDIEELAVEAFDKGKRWITFEDVRDHFGISKQKAQRKLKSYNGIVVFAPGNYKPKRYYPAKMKAKVMEHLLSGRNVPIDPIGVTAPSYSFSSKSPLSNCIEPVVIQSLEDYVLPLLKTIPPNIHNMHFKTKINPDCYTEHYIKELQEIRGNRGKQMFEIIGNSKAVYTFYPAGTVNIEVKCSNHPFKLETEIDHANILVFFGQLRSRLITFLNDQHERIVPDIMDWYLTECDIDRDVKVGDWLHFTGTKIQVKHLNHLFQVYIKSMGRDTVCRVEERKRPNRPPLEVINDIFNPYEKFEKRLDAQDKLLRHILYKLR
jgi:hypothetical protein